MSWTFIACVLIAFAWIGLFYLWGKGFLTVIKAESNTSSSISFGYLVLQVAYHLIYLPFYLMRGSYRTTVYIWLCIVAVGSIGLVLYLKKHKKHECKKRETSLTETIEKCIAIIMILGLAFYISLHVPFYGADTITYISTMNNSYYQDAIWIRNGNISFHNGMCSLFQFFTIPSLLTGIKPYYNALFTVRVVGICLTSLIIFRIGKIIFSYTGKTFLAMVLAVVVSYMLMFWGSNYTAEFFYWRINEAKGYCQFVLLPLGFSVFLAMMKDNAEREKLWKEELLVGLAAIPVSASSLTPYIFLVFMGTFALLGFDKLKRVLRTTGSALVCVIPNLIYLAVYILDNKGIIAL